MPAISGPMADARSSFGHPVKVALFAKWFLEPTHVAIAQVIRGLSEIEFSVFAKGFGEVPQLPVPNATRKVVLDSGRLQDRAISKCDLVHAIYDGGTTFQAFESARACGLPFLLSFHGGFDTNSKIWKASYRELTREMCEAASAVTVVSKTDVDRLASIGVLRPIEVAPVPIDLNSVPKRPMIGSDAPIIAIGRLVRKKGYHIALAAFKLLPGDLRLEIIGEGPEDKSLRETAHALGIHERVEFLGFLPLDETLRRLAKARFLLHPAIQAEDGNAEGTPQVILWSHAIGTPVIAGASGSISNIVAHEHSGLVVPPNDPLKLAAAILRLLLDPGFAERLAQTAQAIVQSKHDLEACVAAWRRRYAEVVRGAPRPNSRWAFSTSPSNSQFLEALESAAKACGTKPDDLRLFEMGGQGLIYRNEPVEGGARAVKLPIYDGSEHQRKAAEARILREGRILAELTARGSRWTPRLHSHDPGGRFLVRDFIRGDTLHDAVQRLSHRSRIGLIPPLFNAARALFDLLHNATPNPFVVRDLKPRNLVLVEGKSPSIYIVDVGSIRSTGQESRRQSKTRLGTRNWLFWAPEMLLSNGKEFSPSSDYFSLGATLFYLLFGRPPFSNREADPDEFLASYADELESAIDSVRQASFGSELPPNLAEWLSKCLSLSAEDRPTRIPPWQS